MNRRLYRCRHDKRLAGVSSGLAEYFDVDVSLVRVLWVLSIFFGGIGILAYIVLAIIVPMEPEYPPQPGHSPTDIPTGSGQPEGSIAPEGIPVTATSAPFAPHAHGAWYGSEEPHQHRPGSGIGITFVGLILILFGALALVDGYLPNWADSGRFLWPAFILGVGALLVATAIRRRPNEQ
ncbi:MAG: PspC domain-containing protein [Chloroflexota bacterium]